jgi:hypothetical protein
MVPLFLFVSTLFSQEAPLFDVDVRIRVVNDEMLYVVVQVDNRSGDG